MVFRKSLLAVTASLMASSALAGEGVYSSKFGWGTFPTQTAYEQMATHQVGGNVARTVQDARNRILTSSQITAIGSQTTINNNGDGNNIYGNSRSEGDVSTDGVISARTGEINLGRLGRE